MSLFGLLIALIVLGGLAYLLWWAVGALGLPAPFDKLVRGVVIVIIVVLAVGLFTGTVPIPALRL